MTYAKAKLLHNGDEVQLKRSREYRYVVETEVFNVCDCAKCKGGVQIMLDDGKWYSHLDVL